MENTNNNNNNNNPSEEHRVPSPSPPPSLRDDVPVVDLKARSLVRSSNDNDNDNDDGTSKTDDEIAKAIAQACATCGFFQVTSHGISTELLQRFQDQCQAFFALQPSSTYHNPLRRNGRNARGYFDDELTRQRIDWKQCLDVGIPASRSWPLPDDHPLNAQCLDGINRFPLKEDLPQFRDTVAEYFDACATLSHTLAQHMARGLELLLLEKEETEEKNATAKEGGVGKCGNNGTASSNNSYAAPETAASSAAATAAIFSQDPRALVQTLQHNHSSFLRLNHYPPCDNRTVGGGNGGLDGSPAPPPLGISPHRDAGFLTVLLQDDNCHSLQVWHRNNGCDSNDDCNPANGNWRTVIPIPGALTINTGDMAQIWSNALFQAPLHRVLTNRTTHRYSAPFFYNPPYEAWIQPVVQPPGLPLYQPVLWGYFRSVRFAGDWTDLGVEIQIEHFLRRQQHSDGTNECGGGGGAPEGTHDCHPDHTALQQAFAAEFDLRQPFNVEQFQDLLQRHHQQ